MNDMADEYRAIRAESKQRRAGNRERSIEELRNAGVAFEAKNHGTHLILRNEIDFWPGTGLWSVRASSLTGRGVFNLIRHLAKGTT